MKLSAKTGVALTITALSLVVTVGAGASRPADPAEEDPFIYITQLPPYAAHVDLMKQLRSLTEPNAIEWGWSHGLANDQASVGMTPHGGS